MDSRDILTDTTAIHFTLDTESLDAHISNSSPLEKLLHYRWHDNISFLRFPDQSSSSELDAIPAYQIDRDSSEDHQEITWNEGDTVRCAPLPLDKPRRRDNIRNYNKPEPDIDDIKRIDTFDILIPHSSSNERLHIIVTENQAILSNRRKIEYKYRGHNSTGMHIMTTREAAEFTGIYLRNNNEFIFYSSADGDLDATYSIDRTRWCWNISQLLIPHFNTNKDEYLSSMVDRVEGLIVGIDQIGEQHYKGTGNNTDIMVRYHFNNCISLLTGIGDVLALFTRDYLDVSIPDRHATIRTGNNDILKELREENEDAWLHIHENHQFIELLHLFRNEIIHQCGVIPRGPGYSQKGEGGTIEWESHVIGLGRLSADDRENFKKYYRGIDDPMMSYEPMSEWGILTTNNKIPEISEYTCIDSYQFIKHATKEMVAFVDKYLCLLGFSNQINSMNNRGLRHSLERVAKEGLFPLIDDIDPKSLSAPESGGE